MSVCVSKGDVRVQAKVVSLETGLLGGDGFFMQRVSGTGTAFIHAGQTDSQTGRQAGQTDSQIDR